MARSVTTAAARRSSQRGSSYERLTRWSPSRSAHSGWIGATVRAHSRLVSTSSAAITQRGSAFATDDVPVIANLDPCAPRYSRASRRASRLSFSDASRPGRCSAVVSRMPICDSSPGSSAWCTRSG